MGKPKTAPVAPPAQRVALGVYTSRERYTAIAIKHTDRGIWYLTMLKGSISLEHSGDEKFQRDFPFTVPNYPLLRAVRKYETSSLARDERTQKVMRRLLESL